MQVQMPRNATAQQNTHNGNKSDKVPNIYWRSVSNDQLRQEPRYVALPPVSLLASTQGALSYRYVRQDSQLWRELHDGMLTTGRLKQALGMHEPKAAQLVGIHPGSRGSSHLLSAYFHLLTTAGSNSAEDWPQTVDASSSSSSRNARNEDARRLFNEQLETEGAAAGRPAGAPAAGPTVADLQAACHRVGLAGDIPVKLAWGKAQEAAALHCLLQLFPEAAVEEVGLFVVNPSELPAAWGIDSSSQNLPRCGASPDGLIVHKLTLQQQDLQAAARLAAAKGDEQQALQWLLQQGLDRQVCTGSRPARGVPLADSSSSSSSSEQGEAVNEEAGEQEQDVGGSDASSSEAVGNSSSSSSSTLVTLAAESARFSDAAAAAAAAAGQAASSSGPAAGSAPASIRAGVTADTPSSSQQHGSTSTAAAAAAPWAAAAGALAFEPVAAALLRLLQAQQEANNNSTSSSSSGSSQVQRSPAASGTTIDDGSSSSSGSEEIHTLYVREVVEVKNHCPFAFRSKRKGKKGRVHVAYGFNARGPAQRVHPQWVPQLQMHMLATGCQSALLVSRCAHSGVRVFRLWRDDAYLQTMLQLLSVLQTQHVLQSVQPSAATFNGLPGYKAFLHRTAALARSAECIAAAGEEVTGRVPVAPDGYNLEKFWQ